MSDPAGPAADTQPRAARAWSSRTLFAIAAASLVAGALAAVTYERHASAWMRPPPLVPSCVRASRTYLKERQLVAGFEPHTSLTGETLYLNEPEDRAVRCLFGLSADLGKAFTTAFGEPGDEARVPLLLAAGRDHVRPDEADDANAVAAYLIASYALRSLPKSPAGAAATDELDRLHACRFDTGAVCASRPPMPWLVYAAGAPSAAGLLTLAGVGLRRAWRALRCLRRRRAARKAASASKKA